ncbi:MAG TPA: glycosyltransferase [Acidimicrobiales bacterium]|nr:glycosyltransferase [Acidimicrobiales bacterium]
MRVALFATAAAMDFDVHVIVVPVAGAPPRVSTPTAAPFTVTVVELAQRAQMKRDLSAMLGDAAGRARLAAAAPLPAAARRASPVLAAEIAALLPPGPVPVHVTRSYLAPLGVAVAERIGAPWTTLDLDDDDESVVARLGDAVEAEAYGRLVHVFAPLFTATAVAAAHEADALAARHPIAPAVIPNAVVVPERTGQANTAPPDDGALLFVGNLTYPPNVEAATTLALDVVPEVRRLVGRRVVLSIAGPVDAGPQAIAGHDPDVRWLGFVPDLAPVYAAARVVVAPLRAGGGTRIKLLEAFAHRVPVVSSTAGAAGLDVVDGVHLLIADGAVDTARAVVRVLEDDSLARALRDNAADLVRRSYSHEAVTPLVRAFLSDASASG